VIVSNRLPVTVQRRRGDIVFKESVGGLATGLKSCMKDEESVWIGWPGVASDRLTDAQRASITERVCEASNCRPVFLTERQLSLYYHGFSNKTIWPLFHYFPEFVEYSRKTWSTYQVVNGLFADAVADVVNPGDRVWMHDYHLLLLPQMLRERLGDVPIGFFLHIPFPSFETYRVLPWREKLLEGILGADLVGFHTYDYAEHFLACVRRLTGLDHEMGQVRVGDRIVKVDSFPMGIDVDKFSQSGEEAATAGAIELLGHQLQGRRLVLSVDRLDYSKGLLRRLEAVDEFFSRHPEQRGVVQVVMVAVPSRSRVRQYELLKRQVEEMVGRVNGRHGVVGWTPIQYMYKSMPFSELCALYRVADVCLVTPLRDGMNLIAKEYIAVQSNEDPGVLVLSETAGAAREMGEALIVNPNNIREVADTLYEALAMPLDDRQRRTRVLAARLRNYDVSAWAGDFTDSLEGVRMEQAEQRALTLSERGKVQIAGAFSCAVSRAILLDYDGTLMEMGGRWQSGPDKELLGLLLDLRRLHGTRVLVMSGRDRELLASWFASAEVDLVAENGVWLREGSDDWIDLDPSVREWQNEFLPVLERFVDRTPGSYIERMDASLAWVYRATDYELGEVRSREFKEAVLNLSEHLDLSIHEGHRMIEIRHSGVSKAHAASQWLRDEDFVLAAGHAEADEEVFASMPKGAFTVKVGQGASSAQWNVMSVADLREILRRLVAR